MNKLRLAVVAAVACFASVHAARADYTLSTLVTFQNSDGAVPVGLVADAFGNLYGTTYRGGPNDLGMIYKVAANTHTMSTLVTFNGTGNGSYPYASMLVDAQGNLFGTTSGGGTYNKGTIFRVDSGTGALTTLAPFRGSTNGANPYGGLVVDGNGNFYGTTFGGGTYGDGVIFKMTGDAQHTLTALQIFSGTNGHSPEAGLVADFTGNLYGTTYQGGSSLNGNIFKLVPGTNTLSTLVSFNGTNGSLPSYGNLIVDNSGNLYGTTSAGGAYGKGTVFEYVASSKTLSTLVNFNTTNGANPQGGLTIDSAGNLFGTTEYGGAYNAGTVFEVAAGTQTATTLVSFNGSGNGTRPWGTLLADPSGNLYGTTIRGGANNMGTVFELSLGSELPEPALLGIITPGIAAVALRRRR